LSKYLAIKNWDKYQSAKKNCSWIKDWVDKDFDPEISKLTVFQRGILDMCCRLRGRLAKNLSNDPQWIVGAVSIMPQERRNAMSAIGQLIAKGFLVPTNQQLDSLDKDKEIEKEREKEEERPQSPQSLTVRIPLKTPPPKPSPELGPDDLTFVVLREIGIPARNPELTTLVASAITAKARSPDWTAEKAALHMIERGSAYKTSWIWNTQYKKSWIKWFQDECYDQDPQAWTQNGVDRNGNSKQTALDRNREALRKATEETS